jgi:hypothetical protein
MSYIENKKIHIRKYVAGLFGSKRQRRIAPHFFRCLEQIRPSSLSTNQQQLLLPSSFLFFSADELLLFQLLLLKKSIYTI